MSDMRDVIDRIREVIRSEGLKNEDFASEIGETPRRLKSILAEQQRLPADVVKAICIVYNVSPNWMYFGRGKMYSGDVEVSPYEAKIINKLSSLSEEVQEAIWVLIDNSQPIEKDKKPNRSTVTQNIHGTLHNSQVNSGDMTISNVYHPPADRGEEQRVHEDKQDYKKPKK